MDGGAPEGWPLGPWVFLLCPPALLATLFHRFHPGCIAFPIWLVALQRAASIIVVPWAPDATMTKPHATARGSHDLSQVA